MKKIISSFHDLTPDQLYDLLKLRQDVFVIEQNCIYQDFDGHDKKATHFLIYDKDTLAAYSRIFGPDIKYENECSIGRIIVSPPYRGGKFGKILIEESIDYCNQYHSETVIRIEAQATLEEYYSKLGFKSDSEIYQVDEIDHLQMIYTFKR
tara:strand:- start:29326 stop:29778 length:453 start_codon:yes stop_codon:yes gene_type:complete